MGPPPQRNRNAILYVLENGIKWRAMPHDLPHGSTAYPYFRKWQKGQPKASLQGFGRGQLRPWSGGTGKEKGGMPLPAPWWWRANR
ncbi:transposase [Thermus tengchongensis]|uniref:transposase n=1 Tax=Thermus tengchongensis TaxID=1214928 RepID=UPI0039B77B1C